MFRRNPKLHWYQIKWEYCPIIKENTNKPPNAHWYTFVGLRKQNIIFDKRQMHKHGGKRIKHLLKDCLCNGRLHFIVISYLGYFRAKQEAADAE